ncbi:ALK and LTK ligand 1 isoform X2 [Pristis pectinata]|uniref:ALK and LTK ligand 1 isoform X2 n=1 Tax=Pristis pectinata TaxID=685728 RepID=UPI00223CC978|nr:ALK and LTK ligand 1 isoform X2 [Pristis pectinata]
MLLKGMFIFYRLFLYVEMGRRRWHTLLGIALLLVNAGHCEGRAETRQKARQSPLDLILKGVGDSNNGGRNTVKRYDTFYALDQDYKQFTKEKAVFVPRLDKPIEVVHRDSNLKGKFLKHFAGPISFSSECSKQFQRLYYNTRDCSTPAFICISSLSNTNQTRSAMSSSSSS